MRHTLFLAILFTLVSFSAHAQEEGDEEFQLVETRFIMPLNFTVVRERAQDDVAYAAQLAQFNAADQQLGLFDIAMIYYGWVFRPGYKGNLDAENSPVERLVSEGRFAQAWDEGAAYLKNNPVSLTTIQHMIEAGNAAGKPVEEIERLQWQLDKLLQVIFYSGDGTTENNAFKVISKTDEFIFIDSMLGVKRHAGSVFLPTFVSRYDVVSADNFGHRWLYMDSSLANHFGPAWEPKETE